MSKRGYTISEVKCYTISGKEIKVYLTNRAKNALISKMRNAATLKGGLKNAKGSLKILNSSGKVVKSLPLSSLKPIIKVVK